jgi:hypothetical protein
VNFPAALWEVSLQNLPQTRADFVSTVQGFAPRALLQIFIKTTPHHRLQAFVKDHAKAFAGSARMGRFCRNT